MGGAAERFQTPSRLRRRDAVPAVEDARRASPEWELRERAVREEEWEDEVVAGTKISLFLHTPS